MNIILKHTLNSIVRNPVQSVIVVLSTAMITACMLLCLTISYLFEVNVHLWADAHYAGSDVVIDSTNEEDVANIDAYIEEHAEEVSDHYTSIVNYLTVQSAEETVQARRISTPDPEKLNRLTGAEVLHSCVNDTEFISAYVSLAFSDVMKLGLGDTFTDMYGNTYFIVGICNSTARYYATPYVAFVSESDGQTAAGSYYVYLRDPDALRPDGRTVKDAWREEVSELIGNSSGVRAANDVTQADADKSVRGSMQLMSVAAAVITVVMACLLYSSFSVIVRGRVNELVKFKAAGATPMQSTLILLTEAVVYALVGALIGLGVGEGLVQYINSLLFSGVVSAGIVPEAGDYLAALAIGALCGIAACALPSARMGAKPIRRLLGGSERMTAKIPVWAAVPLTAAPLSFNIAAFFAEGTALVAVSFISVALSLVWLILMMPHVLSGVCALGSKLSRTGAASLAMRAAPRNAAVSSSHTMLAALIAFISLGMCLIDIVNMTGVPSTSRFGGDFFVTAAVADDESAMAELEKCLATAGITDGAFVRVVYAAILADENGNAVGGGNDPAAEMSLYAVSEAADIRYLVSTPLPDDVMRRFDRMNAEGGNPVILSYNMAHRFGFDVGDKVRLLTATHLGALPLDGTFTVVGIDSTVTSADFLAFLPARCTYISDAYPDGPSLYTGGSYIFRLSGDKSRFAEIREKLDSDILTVYTREGFFPSEDGDNIDAERILGIFSAIIYAIAAAGLANLIVITAGERRREFDILRLSGMTSGDAARYILSETTALSVSGACFGLLFAFFANGASPGIGQLIEKYFPLDIFPSRIAVIAAVATGIFALLWTVCHLIAYGQISSPNYRRRADRMLRSD